MIVLDASAAFDALLDAGPRGEWARDGIARARVVHAPELIDLEVVSAVRRHVGRHGLEAARAARALDDLGGMRMTRWPHRVLVPRIWALRDAMSVYDAAYVALAETIDAAVLTTDAAFARADHAPRVQAFPG